MAKMEITRILLVDICVWRPRLEEQINKLALLIHDDVLTFNVGQGKTCEGVQDTRHENHSSNIISSASSSLVSQDSCVNKLSNRISPSFGHK
jgi:hypothetical protein